MHHRILKFIFYGWFIYSIFINPLHASVIESTIGAAVVNDATATYYNPAALTLLKNNQIIGLDSFSNYETKFRGRTVQVRTAYTLIGDGNAHTQFQLPAVYYGTPLSNYFSAGFAVIYNKFERDNDNFSILRYVNADNQVKALDFVPAIGIKLHKKLAIGFGFSFTHVHFDIHPIVGFPSLNIPDIKNEIQSNGTSWGWFAGVLITPSESTMIGMTLRNLISYNLSGKSIFNTNPPFVSDQFKSKFWTPRRIVFSINHFVTSSFGFIGTLQHIQWDVFEDIPMSGLAVVENESFSINSTFSKQHRKNSWIVTLGSHYRIYKPWVIRIAATYNQGSINNHFQIGPGDSLILSGSTGYDINKTISLDFGYSHSFIKGQGIRIIGARNLVFGKLNANRDAVSLKMTVNL